VPLALPVKGYQTFGLIRHWQSQWHTAHSGLLFHLMKTRLIETGVFDFFPVGFKIEFRAVVQIVAFVADVLLGRCQVDVG